MRRFKIITALALFAALPALILPTLGKPAVGKVVKVTKPPAVALMRAPNFTLTDADGNARSLKDYRGRPVVLFFSCGCPWCARCARLWGEFQRGGTLNEGPLAGKNVATIVVASSDGSSAKQFAQDSGMDLSQTLLLPDTEMKVTNDLYHVDPCPRFFVVDPNGMVRYTNNHKDDKPREAPEMAIVSRTLDALRASVISTAGPRPALTKTKKKTLPL